MPTRTKSAWRAHCWIFCLSQFGMPTTGLGVKLGICPLLTKPGKDTCICQFSRVFTLAGLSRAKASHRPSRLSLVVFLVVLRHFRSPLDWWVSSASVIVTSVFVSGCSPEFEGVFPAAHNYSVLPVGILCASFYPFKSKMLLIVLNRVLV